MALIDGPIDNEENLASSKKTTTKIPNSKRKCKLTIPSLRPNYQNRYFVSDQNVLKNIPFEAGHTYVAHIIECPSLLGQSQKEVENLIQFIALSL